ncbi:MAG: fumarylacetoacetate hydrolase family protein [Hylemonella sp.]|nr:fumarylacetoacetate hydrolase family protein [Hylemonella sp.]
MRLFSFEAQGQARIGVLRSATAQEFVDLSVAAPSLPGDMGALIAQPGGLQAARQAAAQASAAAVKPLAGARYLPVVPRPGKIVCLGLNYADHAKEGGHARPEYPSFFMRGASSMTGHQEPIIRPRASTKLDYEAELAVVIGQRARHLTKSNALDCVAGYSCFNDGSVRDYQRKTAQWTIGKNFDATGPFGPWLVTPDELPPGAAGLRIQSRLNGQVMQDANTKDFLWDVVESLCIITECMTLEPGDVIITGTPAGVGYARTPPVWMAPGDVCEIEIEGIGILSNPIADE